MELGRFRRREMLAGLCASPWLALSGCQTESRLPPAGEIVDTAVERGHRLRDGWKSPPAEDVWRDVEVVIVGGGIAGLTAAWELRRQGLTDFVVLEMDSAVGGTSQATRYGSIPAPWGAHYLPLPMPHQKELLALLDEMGVLEGISSSGEPLAKEQNLCREPEERLFHAGDWHDGLFLQNGASTDDLRQWAEFQAEVERWANFRDASGRRAFTIPVSQCSDDPAVIQLDRITFAEWLAKRGFTSSRVLWTLDYACRDDFGLRLSQTSAWAGLFYFASRLAEGESEPQPLLTWPEGNGRIVEHLRQRAGETVHTGAMVLQVIPASQPHERIRVACAMSDGTMLGYRARRVLWAAPQFVAARAIDGYQADPRRAGAVQQFHYGSWFVANLCLSDRPKSSGHAPAWDNVFYDSPSLGYVVATHQQLRDHGATVWTYYYPLCGDDPKADRQWLLEQSWASLAEMVLSDIEQAHPEIRELTTRLDIYRWGHGMIRPEPGFLWSSARQIASEPWRDIHFAHTDLSGVALCEEAFDHGLRAAREVIAALHHVEDRAT